MPDEMHPELDDLFTEVANEAGMPKGMVVDQIERNYGIDLSDVPDEDAEKFVTAWNDKDPERIGEVLRDNGVDDDDVERFLEFVEDESTGNGDSTEGNGHDPDTEVSRTNTESDSGGSSDDTEYVTQAELDAALNQQADAIASQVASKLQSSASSGNQQGQQGQPQNQTQAALAQALAQKFLNDGGSSQAAMLGEKLQSKAMESAMQRMFAPDPFDIMRQKWAMQQAEQFMEDDELKDMFGASGLYDMPDMPGDDDEDEESGGLFKFGGN